MRLEYQAFDKAGRAVSNVMEAANEAEATEKLRQQDLYVAEIRPAGEAAPVKQGGLRLPRSRIRKLRELAMFTRQLYAMVHSGTQLAQGLAAMERQAKDQEWGEMIKDIRTRLEQGTPLSDAMKAHDDYFDAIYTSLVAAGESSGKLPVLLDRLAAMTRKRVHVMAAVRGAMIYPALLATVATGVLVSMLLFVVPRFGELFHNIGAPLPPTTAVMIAAGNCLRDYWWIFLPALVAAVVMARHYLTSAAGKSVIDRVSLRLPLLGKIVRSFAVARLARILGVLMDSHLPVQEVLHLTRATTSHGQYADLLAKAEAAVGRGDPISLAFQDSDLISPAVYETIRSGEQSGQVGTLLLELSDFLDEENEVTLKSLTSIVEPILLVFMGAIVGLVAISIFVPLFDVTSMIGGGH